jgi:hypothetical protein
MSRKSGYRFAEKIMLKQNAEARWRFEETSSRSSPVRQEGYMRALAILSALVIGAALALSATPAAAWWQFAINGPNGERQTSPHFASEKECKEILKLTAEELAKKYPDLYPLVGSCEQYR